MRHYVFFLFLSGLTISTTAKPGDRIYQKGFLSKEQAHQSIELQDGYSLELVLSEPEVQEPVMVAWDGNGVMYVVQMNTYMQDLDASGEKKPSSRITRHVDTDGNGTYDQHTIYADNLVLPRFVLPLDDRVMVGVTDTLDLWNYRDTTGDGVADEQIKIHDGGRRGGNMEHQPSGLMWGLDNWLYLTYEAQRYRFTNGKLEVQKMAHGSGQWGLTQDDWGRMYYSSAGSEKPAMDFQQPLVYGRMGLKGEKTKDFLAVYPIAEIPDVQGGDRRVGSNGGLNYFTGVAGQSIFRGDRLPEDLRGDLLIPEPVGRLIRRAKVERKHAKSVLSNAYRNSEFIRSRDANFRPVWSATTPGGQMMIVDMHRGIIQQGNWTKKGSYLRKIIERWDLDKNIGKGRIYRLVHQDFKAGTQPKMLDESTEELLSHLSHPNGWWRDTAQKLIILREDRESVVPALKEMVKADSSELGRLHALWTLEGMDKVSPDLLAVALKDDSSIVRTSAIRVAEPFMALEDETVLRTLSEPFPRDAEMVVQFLNSRTASGATHSSLVAMDEKLADSYGSSEVVQAVIKSRQAIAETAALASAQRKQGVQFASSMERGKAIYEQLCFACHGADGQGAPMAGQPGHKLAPSFTNSPRVLGTGDGAIRVLLHGMTGPIDGKAYEGIMVPMANNDDQWIADVVTYLRNSFDNKASIILPVSVATLRKDHTQRNNAWTEQELAELEPSALPFQRNWKLKASHNVKDLRLAFDGNQKTRYTTKKSMVPKMWIQIEFPRETEISSLILDTLSSKDDYPRGYQVEFSDDGKNWGTPLAVGEGSPLCEISFPKTTAKFLRVTQTGNHRLFWSIHEMTIKGKELF